MLDSREFRELLIADLALVRGVAEARDVAAALQRFWERREEGVSLADELAHIARIPREALLPIEEEVDRLIAEAGGNAQIALTRRGGMDRSIHLALGDRGTQVSMALTEVGAGARAPLHTVDPARYTDFMAAGEGGMGIVYLAVDTEMNREVAFKVVRPDVGSRERKPTPANPIQADPPARDTPASHAFEVLKARFLQEAWVAGGLSHPGIVPVYEMGQTPTGVPYYTMRFVKGQRTLKDALDEVRNGPVEDRLKLLEPFLKLCDTVAYAHSKGVIHRDLKPENVALGEFGEVVLLDWGLAKLEGQDDLAASRWQERVQEFREAGDFRTAGMLGTPGYMSPEAALGRIEQIDVKSDVYSLGAMLYETLTGRLPYEFGTYSKFIDCVQNQEPTSLGALATGAPKTLASLAMRCLARIRPDRPSGVEHVARSIRSWQAASALEREIEGHLTTAEAALGAAEAAHADDRLRQVERAAGALEQVAAKQSARPELAPLRGRADALREAGIREREQVAERRALRRITTVALTTALVCALAVAAVVNEQRRRTSEERDAKTRLLDEVLRLADAKKVRDLEDKAAELAPAEPELLARVDAWLKEAEKLQARAPGHELALQRLRKQAFGERPSWLFRDEALAWQHEVLTELVERLKHVSDVRAPLRLRIDRLRRSALATRHPGWPEATKRAAANPRYQGLGFPAQVGLVPLGADPASGLEEFAHVASGSIPTRDGAMGRLRYASDSAIVFVLVPGGTYWIGAQKNDEAKPNFDPYAISDEGGSRQLTLIPYMLVKHECTQAQWSALSGGETPSRFAEGREAPRRPVEQVTWFEARRWMEEHGLRLPTEVEWECACRARTTTPWWTGADEKDLASAAWHAGTARGTPHPVGTKAANAWGFHDVLGNVWEWCDDMWTGKHKAPLLGRGRRVEEGSGTRVCRGGSWTNTSKGARSASRGVGDPGGRTDYLGFRPARSITYEDDQSSSKDDE